MKFEEVDETAIEEATPANSPSSSDPGDDPYVKKNPMYTLMYPCEYKVPLDPKTG